MKTELKFDCITGKMTKIYLQQAKKHPISFRIVKSTKIRQKSISLSKNINFFYF